MLELVVTILASSYSVKVRRWESDWTRWFPRKDAKFYFKIYSSNLKRWAVIKISFQWHLEVLSPTYSLIGKRHPDKIITVDNLRKGIYVTQISFVSENWVQETQNFLGQLHPEGAI